MKPASAALVAVLLLLAPLGAASGASWQAVWYEGPILRAERLALESVAEEVGDHLPPFGLLARLTPAARAAIEARPAVARVADVPAQASADLAAGADAVRVLAFDRAGAAALAAHLEEQGARVFLPDAAEPLLDVELRRVPLAHLLRHDAVRWVEPLRSEVFLDNDRASGIVQGGGVDAWSLHARGVDGSSQVVGYCDTGLDTDAPLGQLAGRARHELFADGGVPILQNVPSPLHRKVALYYAPIDARGLRGDLDDDHGHGTHVAGTLAGDAGAHGARDGHDGVAYAARLAVCDASTSAGFQLLADPAGYWQPAYDVGARVHSNSWGTSPTREYTLAARQHDLYASSHRDMLIVRSVGNTGALGIRPEAAAKSVLAVGAVTNDDVDPRVLEESGRGPTVDGRVKPDLVAPGDCLWSAGLASATAYACMRGTSQATPVVAGAATLVRDHFAKGFYPTGRAQPEDARHVSSALVRAVLVASAVDVPGAGRDAQGWGRPELARALAYEGDGATLLVHDEDAPLATGETWSASIDVAPGASLRVVLVWTDEPASPGASPALVNDLDLEVVTPSGALIQGNAEAGAPDRVNVMERVALDAPEAGAHLLRVRGWNVPAGAQPFALVAVAR